MRFEDYGFFLPPDCSGKQAYVEGKTIREVVLENNLMSEDELNVALDLSKMGSLNLAAEWQDVKSEGEGF